MYKQRIRREDPTTLRSALSARQRKMGMLTWVAVPLLALALPLGGIGYTLAHRVPVRSIVEAGSGVAHAAVPAPMKDCGTQTGPLQKELSELSRQFDGDVGIAVSQVGCDWVAGDRSFAFYPQQSVSKLWVALAVLKAVDRGQVSLEQKLTIGPSDLTLFNQPLRHEVLEKGQVSRSVHSLLEAALSRSDNTANDRLLRAVGGSAAVTEMMNGISGSAVRFGPGERRLQSGIAGLQWSPAFSLGRNFEEARGNLPPQVRLAALENYLADPVDGAQPSGIAHVLALLSRGDLLSPGSTEVMMDILARTHSGPRRLKAGAPPDWAVFHKTGTGQELGKVATGYNDVGLLRAPDGTMYSVAVMIGKTTTAIPDRMALMQNVTRTIVKFHEVTADGVAGENAENLGSGSPRA